MKTTDEAMNDIIERVARALCEDCSLDWGTSMQDRWRLQARAAIAAMREPTEAMEEASVTDHGNGMYSFATKGDCWKAMIDEALK